MNSKDRLSRQVRFAKDSYQAIVVGSGYGAGVAAFRLAQLGLDVAVLERGIERIPGEFPKTLGEASKEFQLHKGKRQFGRDLALFDMRVQDDISVLLGCGLGGTSLINGNVMLQPEPRVLADSAWPEVLRKDVNQHLNTAYTTALFNLQATPYPNQIPLQKLAAFKLQAAAMGGKLTLPPINVTFDPEQLPSIGARQPACTLCGDCCSGCNVGAKNTVAMNYLPAAKSAGAQLFTHANILWIERTARGWLVHIDGDEETGTTAKTIRCRHLFLGAGTLGSTEILLRSADRGLKLSDRVGEQFSGNGDVLAFGYNNDMPVNGIGIGHPVRTDVPPVGPVIAGLVDLRRSGPVANNMVIQEGVLPSSLAPLLPAMLAGAGPLFGTDTDKGDFFTEAARTFASLATGAYRGAVHNTQTYLVMAHEAAQGRMELRQGKLAINWPEAGEDPIFKKISHTLHRATAATGGTYLPNPIWSESLGRNLVSVHPLGGCALADSADNGVVNDLGQVFNSSTGEEVYSGLYVLDGSIIPRSLGVNPSLTITALAERALSLLTQQLLQDK